jgi:hypothetical protein
MPVELDEALCNLTRGERELLSIVASDLNRQVSKRDEQSVLVGRGEIALGKESLQLREEHQLRIGTWGRGELGHSATA